MSVAAKKKSRVREARASAYRTLVLEAAERVFAAKGFEGAKIKDVADAAGLALGTVYTLYPSKRDVFVAVHEHRGGALLATLLEAMAGCEAPFEALARGESAACAFYAQHPAYLRMHLHSGTSWAAPRLDVDEERRTYEAGVRPLRALFERAAERGELVDEDPGTCARMYLAMVQVLLSEWEAERFRTPPAEVAARIGRQARRTFQRA